MASSHRPAAATSILRLRRRPPTEALTMAASVAADLEFPKFHKEENDASLSSPDREEIFFDSKQGSSPNTGKISGQAHNLKKKKKRPASDAVTDKGVECRPSSSPRNICCIGSIVWF